MTIYQITSVLLLINNNSKLNPIMITLIKSTLNQNKNNGSSNEALYQTSSSIVKGINSSSKNRGKKSSNLTSINLENNLVINPIIIGIAID